MNKYLAINIGPISETFSMARKPREFWAASYMFSLLMENIIRELDNIPGLTLISPCMDKNPDNITGVGLYPDRCFYMQSRETNISENIENVINGFAEQIEIPKDIVKRYFNIMTVSNEYESSSDAITGLNQTLDYMELCKNACNSNDYNAIAKLLRNTTSETPCKLFKIATGKSYFKIDTLEEIAKAGAKAINLSYQRYVCIVQADGDGMGTIVKSKKLEGILSEFSQELMTFGKKACQDIIDYGGLPIYAGGDDLLFIAPVCNNNKTNIFDLIDTIDKRFEDVQKYISEKDPDLETSMSYGVSIIYHKFPLYEAWKTAAQMLFYEAKKVNGKNAIAVNLRKNSGSDLEFKTNKKSQYYKDLKELIKSTDKDDLVSAIAHKMRANNILLDNMPKGENSSLLESRIKAFYDKVIDIDTKNDDQKQYLELTQRVFIRIYQDITNHYLERDEDNDSTQKEIDRIISYFYSMLRIAKFIKGEEVKDE